MWGKSKKSSDAEVFKDYLVEKDIKMDITESEHSISLFSMQSLGNSLPTVRVVVSFRKDQRDVNLYIYDYIYFEQDKKPAILDVINKINCDYIFVTYHAEEDQIAIKYSVDISCGMDCEVLFNQILVMIQTAQINFPTFMKAIWT